MNYCEIKTFVVRTLSFGTLVSEKYIAVEYRFEFEQLPLILAVIVQILRVGNKAVSAQLFEIYPKK